MARDRPLVSRPIVNHHMRIMLGMRKARSIPASTQSKMWMTEAGRKASGPLYWWMSPCSTPNRVKPMAVSRATMITEMTSTRGRR